MSGFASPPRPPEISAEVERFRATGQGQVFRFLSRLSSGEARRLAEQAAEVDLELVSRLAAEIDGGPPKQPALEPILPVGPDDPDRERAVERGRQLFRDGRIAFYTVAGGQGSRLGFEGPKGAFPIGPFSGRTLFEIHAAKVRAASRRYGQDIPWVILVSETNEAPTREFFASRSWLGLEGLVRFVRQRMLPAVDERGKILLRSAGEIMMSPNGHGGSLAALRTGGALDWLARRGVQYVSYFQVDNALLNPADPAFLGYQALRNAEMTAKVVRKQSPEEKAGVVARLDGRPGVVEYTEISEEDARARNEDGSLRFDLANIAAHGFRLDFLERVSREVLPWHATEKTVPTVDEAGRPVERRGRKFESFVFDAIPRADRFFAFLTEREEEFAPLKNAKGANSPAAVREALLERTRRWYRSSGLTPPDSEKELEMSPENAYDLETFRDWIASRAEGDRP